MPGETMEVWTRPGMPTKGGVNPTVTRQLYAGRSPPPERSKRVRSRKSLQPRYVSQRRGMKHTPHFTGWHSHTIPLFRREGCQPWPVATRGWTRALGPPAAGTIPNRENSYMRIRFSRKTRQKSTTVVLAVPIIRLWQLPHAVHRLPGPSSSSCTNSCR